jgi:hypothetical protein
MTLQVEDYLDHDVATPEHILWLAVIERAIIDYIDPCCRMTKLELGALELFFFSKRPKPCNLIYICQNVFDYPDACEAIRTRVKHLKAAGPKSFNRAKRYRISS